jgi:hypothetical protein
MAAMGGPFWAIVAGCLSNPASAGGAAPGLEPPLRGSYCEESEQDLAPARPGCARISGYIAAGARFTSDERVGGRPDFFAPLNDPGIAGGASGFKIVGSPPGGEPLLLRASPGDAAR